MDRSEAFAFIKVVLKTSSSDEDFGPPEPGNGGSVDNDDDDFFIISDESAALPSSGGRVFWVDSHGMPSAEPPMHLVTSSSSLFGDDDDADNGNDLLRQLRGTVEQFLSSESTLFLGNVEKSHVEAEITSFSLVGDENSQHPAVVVSETTLESCARAELAPFEVFYSNAYLDLAALEEVRSLVADR
jgi:hypothetical protein